MANIPKAKYETQDYVLEGDKELDPAEQTKWRIKSLCGSDFVTAQDLWDSGKHAAACVFAFRRGCLGWDNLKSDGEVVTFRGMRFPQDSDKLNRLTAKEIETIPIEWQEEIGAQIIVNSTLSDTEKN